MKRAFTDKKKHNKIEYEKFLFHFITLVVRQICNIKNVFILKVELNNNRSIVIIQESLNNKPNCPFWLKKISVLWSVIYVYITYIFPTYPPVPPKGSIIIIWCAQLNCKNTNISSNCKCASSIISTLKL